MVSPVRLRTAAEAATAGDCDTPATPGQDISIGPNLRALRLRRGLSLESVAKLSGVSRAMLSQIEVGRSAPSINTISKIARAFDVPVSALLAAFERQPARILPAAQAKTLASSTGDFSSRALFPYDAARRAEFYELRLAPGGFENADAHAPGTMENLIVAKGMVEIGIGKKSYLLPAGDAFLFQADETHSYRNLSTDESVIYLVMTYRDSVV